MLSCCFLACNCYPLGTVSAGVLACNPTTGDCPCLPNVKGRQCDMCEVGYWNLASGQGETKWWFLYPKLVSSLVVLKHNVECNSYLGLEIYMHVKSEKNARVILRWPVY